MKIYSRAEFMKLPEGTVFIKEDLFRVKGETWDVDFIYRSLIDIESHDSNQLFDRLEEMEKKGTSYPINKDYSRDGMFDDSDLFLVFEKDDLLEIKNVLQTALNLDKK